MSIEWIVLLKPSKWKGLGLVVKDSWTFFGKLSKTSHRLSIKRVVTCNVVAQQGLAGAKLNRRCLQFWARMKASSNTSGTELYTF